MTYVIAEPCIDVMDKACIEECPVDCIYEGRRMLYIHPDECVDCGACEPVCPVEAIFYEDDLPAEWAHYVTVDADFFDDLGSPGGAAKIGPTGHDHPTVVAHSRRERPSGASVTVPQCRRIRVFDLQQVAALMLARRCSGGVLRGLIVWPSVLDPPPRCRR
ncbi:MAG: ferredoxin [Rhodococcus sp. (in: high G+C Gram-positive bacteria)]